MTSVTLRMATETVDLGHAFRPLEAAASHGALSQFPQEPAAGGSSAACLHVDGSQHIVGE